jgi:hypothetical protein
LSTSAQVEKLTAPAAGAPAQVERLFQGSLLLLIITGFVTLASTGKLDFISVAFTSLALIHRVYLFVVGRVVQIEERWTSYLGFVYIVVYIADFFFLTGNFVTATVHLVLFGMVVKLFSVRRERDYIYLAVLGFLMVLSAAVLTVDTIFLIAFGLFSLTAVMTFMTMEMRRSAAAATNMPHNSVGSVLGADRVEVAISKTGAAILLGIAVFGAGIFFVLPRLSYGYLSRLSQQNTLGTGFSDNVTLGQIGRIQQSSQVALHIKVEGDDTGTLQLRLRGSTLTTFDGKRWTNSTHNFEILRSAPTGGIDLEHSARKHPASLLLTAKSARRHPIHYRVMMEPLGTNVVFLVSRTGAITGRFHDVAIDSDNTVLDLDVSRTAEYQGSADIAEPSPQELKRGPAVPAEIPRRYLDVPGNIDPRIVQLAHAITDSKGSPYDKAAALERHLATSYGYTLDLGSTPPADPLANFLFERKRGHCEYFASAMALMLRGVGIPSRIVTGFRGGEYNNVSGSYIIRARDAHSWVEAYLPEVGWTTFDPTPSGGPAVISGWRRAELYLDAAREFWREWIVNYDIGHQETLAVSTLAKSRSMASDVRNWIAARYNSVMLWARRTNAAMERDPKAAGGRLVLFAAALMALLNAAKMWRLFRRARLARNPQSAPQSAATIWYERVLRLTAKSGYRRGDSQTPSEFAACISDPELQASVVEFAFHYEKARFGSSAEDAALLPVLYRRMLTRK